MPSKILFLTIISEIIQSNLILFFYTTRVLDLIREIVPRIYDFTSKKFKRLVDIDIEIHLDNKLPVHGEMK